MKPRKEYLDYIAKKLDSMNALSPIRNAKDSNDKLTGYKIPELMDQMGSTALEYLKNKKDQVIKPDPLFPDRN